MRTRLSRRKFLTISAGGMMLGTALRPAGADQDQRDFKLALNERSLDRSLKEKKIDHLDLAAVAKQEFALDAVEYVSSYFSAHISQNGYVNRMNKQAAEHGVRQILIVVDDAGPLADADPKMRKEAVAAHRPWIDVAKALGCHSVSVDVTAEAAAKEDHLKRAVEGLQELAEFAAQRKIHLLVSSNGRSRWDPAELLKLLKAADSEHVGAFPSFDGFDAADPYEAMQQLMPFAKGVCATSQEFDEQGNGTSIDFYRMIKIVLDGGFRGHVGIEYAGTKLDEFAGIRATKALLERVKSAEMKRRNETDSGN